MRRAAFMAAKVTHPGALENEMPTALEYMHENYHRNARAWGENFRPSSVRISRGLFNAFVDELAGEERFIDPEANRPRHYVFRGAMVDVESNWDDWIIHDWVMEGGRRLEQNQRVVPDDRQLEDRRRALLAQLRAQEQHERLQSLPEPEVFDVTFD